MSINANLTKLRHQILPYFLDKYFNGITLFGTSLFYGVILLFVSRTHPWLAIKTFIALFITEIISAIIKVLYRKNRPTQKNRQSLLDHYEAGSFPSIHSARVTILVLLIYYLFPNDPITLLIAAILALAVAYSRIHLKLHYVSDVIAGIILGFSIARLVLPL